MFLLSILSNLKSSKFGAIFAKTSRGVLDDADSAAETCLNGIDEVVLYTEKYNEM